MSNAMLLLCTYVWWQIQRQLIVQLKLSTELHFLYSNTYIDSDHAPMVWSSGIASAHKVAGRDIESRHGI
jgi:hypothetical protein